MENDQCLEKGCKSESFAQHKFCPLSRQELGLYSWSVLHTFIAYFSDNPKQRQSQAIKGLIEAYRYLYPCLKCRFAFQLQYQKDPPNYQNKEELTLWACRQHNIVNNKLGKQLFQCNYQKLQQRWRTGCNQQKL